MLKPIISAAMFSLMALPALADSLTVTVTNITERGEMHLAIYDDADVFENDKGEKGGAAKGIIQGVIEMVDPGTATYEFDIPKGTYTIGIFVDVNLNNKMDTNFLGVPKEQYGFSNNASGFMGPPTFEAASFTVDGPTTQKIDL